MVNLVLTYLVGQDVFGTHQEAFGKSLGIKDLLGGYDRTVLGDWLNSENDQLSRLFDNVTAYSLWNIGIQFLLNVGLIASIAKKETSIIQFFKNIGKYSLPYFLLTILFIFIFGVVAGGIGFAYLEVFKDGFDTFRTELPLFYGAIGGILICLILTGIFWIMIVKAKMLNTKNAIHLSIKKSAVLIASNFRKLILLPIIMLSFFLLTTYLLNKFIIYNSSKSYLLLIMFGILGVLFLYFKILFKIWIIRLVDEIK